MVVLLLCITVTLLMNILISSICDIVFIILDFCRHGKVQATVWYISSGVSFCSAPSLIINFSIAISKIPKFRYYPRILRSKTPFSKPNSIIENLLWIPILWTTKIVPNLYSGLNFGAKSPEFWYSGLFKFW